MSKLLKSTHEGVLSLGDKDLDVAVLEDGTRVVTQTAVFKSLDRPQRGNKRQINLPTFMDAKNLTPLISKELEGVMSKINYLDKNGKEQEGYSANIIPLVSDLYLRAREQGVLHKTQVQTATRAEILVRSLAKLGMTALVDEATGYQYDREAQELQKILKAYISEELIPWQKRFPDEFYIELFRLNGWNYTVKGIKKRPGVVGRWTNTLIYEQLPDGVLDELKKKVPKNTRLHQALTLDVGEPNLTAQINQVLTIFRLSDSMEHMWSNFKRMNDRKNGQLEIDFKFDNKGATIPIDPPIVDKEISDFDQSLKQALDYNPKGN